MGGYDASGSEAGNGRFCELPFGGDQTLGGFDFQAPGFEFRALAKGSAEQGLAIGGERGGRRRIGEDPLGGFGEADGDGEIGEGRLGIVTGLRGKQSGFGDGDLGEAEVKAGLQLGVGEGGDLIEDCLARADGLRGDAQDGLRAEREEVSLTNLEEDLGAGGVRDCRFALGAGGGPFGEEFGASAVVEELGEIGAETDAAEDERIRENTGPDARSFRGCGPRDGDAELRSECAADLLRDLGLGFGRQPGGGDGRVVTQGERFGFRQGEGLWLGEGDGG